MGRNYRRTRYGGKKIARDKYISKAQDGYEAPSVYVEEKSYNDYDIIATLKKNVERKGYIHPTKIQDQAIPYVLDGKDLLGLASTGSGKTDAFLIPILNKISKDRSQKCLIIVPTRELASQIQDEFRELSKDTNLYAALLIGGESVRKQIDSLRRNPQFVIGTPGRLKDLYQRRILKLEQFNNLILDEVDRMLDMGFIPDITFLVSKLKQEKQALFFSATMSDAAEKIANSILRNPVRVQVEKESPLKNIDQDIVKYQSNQQKFSILTDLLIKDSFEKVLIFSRTKRGADSLTKALREDGFRADAIHGNKSQNNRSRALDSFKRNNLDILVATDVASRGLDIPNVSHVINYDEPEDFKTYIHRIGRTGRIGKKGNALTFVN
ncbi:MAG: DEAD/DEAH box helicase [Candidatus Dojkabacteria bacterium]|jgi:superfamily II DNA/RNA helicase|nr:DEAD/DEAH box helicase [Candidatus Dojkabacteria bacterium]MDD2270050.1 DEAD/DEAH box helicase [Candidatus Dojkabacteria bacterium]